MIRDGGLEYIPYESYHGQGHVISTNDSNIRLSCLPIISEKYDVRKHPMVLMFRFKSCTETTSRILALEGLSFWSSRTQ